MALPCLETTIQNPPAKGYHRKQRKRWRISGKTNTGGDASEGSAPVVAVAGEVVLREHPAHGGLVPVGLHKVPPGPVPAQALDGGQVGPGGVLYGNGPFVEVPVLVMMGR